MARQIPWARPTLFGDEKRLVLDALESSWISGGPYVDRLEAEFGRQVGAPEAIAVANGTVALHLALLGLGIGPGDEVIVPDYTFVAAANMVRAVGATLVVADIERDTWLLDPARLEALITPRTRAVIPVHLYGNIADMEGICAVADRHGIAVLEDAAEAAFSRYRGEAAGTIGRIGTFSFHATKTITCGEGGMVVTSDADLAQRMRVLRDHGMRKDKRYWHDVVGYNFRMTNLQAALGCAQMMHLEHICEDRRRITASYGQHLQPLANLGVRPQVFRSDCEPVVWAIAVHLSELGDGVADTLRRREAVMEHMKQAGIETRPGFYALSMLPPYHCPPQPVAQEISAGVISLPTYVGLGEAEIADICRELQAGIERHGR